MTYEGGIRIYCPGKQGKMFYGEGEVNSANTEEGWRWTLSSSQIWQLRGSSLDNHELQSLTAGGGGVNKSKWSKWRGQRGHWRCPATEAVRRWGCRVTRHRDPTTILYNSWFFIPVWRPFPTL